MNWNEIWITLFGTTEWLNLNIGFWVSMNVVLLMVILMHVIFWGRKRSVRSPWFPMIGHTKWDRTLYLSVLMNLKGNFGRQFGQIYETLCGFPRCFPSVRSHLIERCNIAAIL